MCLLCYVFYNAYDDLSSLFSFQNESRVCVLVGVTKREEHNTSILLLLSSSSSSSSSCLMLNWYDTRSFLFLSIPPPFLLLMIFCACVYMGRFDEIREKQNNQKNMRGVKRQTIIIYNLEPIITVIQHPRIMSSPSSPDLSFDHHHHWLLDRLVNGTYATVPSSPDLSFDHHHRCLWDRLVNGTYTTVFIINNLHC